MNKLRQEIENFHENIKPVLEKILEQYDRIACFGDMRTYAWRRFCI